ncbi:ferrochelatase-2, chloroplastic-like [Olea europaea subsp. europaea]|uniref:protoporphyrin ferrochelatase n=1 Tax=Olea europaea subsp. europaea TaxID=158383 RepID=A0A8S0T0Z7_OLEEU|nr:ferrochelatase-2, chloroplastic-like [Olea europaea subsp. europaea]
MNQSMNIRIQSPSPSLLLPPAKCSSRWRCPCIRVQLETCASSNLSKMSLISRGSSAWCKIKPMFSESLTKMYSSQIEVLVTSRAQEVSDTPAVGDDKIGVLLLNLGGPETLEDVQPFLFNLFADPDIIRLPRLFRFLQKPLAKFISVARAPKSKEGYASIGGGSPLRQITDAQAEELRKALSEKNVLAKVYVGMRYWHPFTEEAIEQVSLLWVV